MTNECKLIDGSGNEIINTPTTYQFRCDISINHEKQEITMTENGNGEWVSKYFRKSGSFPSPLDDNSHLVILESRTTQSGWPSTIRTRSAFIFMREGAKMEWNGWVGKTTVICKNGAILEVGKDGVESYL
jgi:hypothetical protein